MYNLIAAGLLVRIPSADIFVGIFIKQASNNKKLIVIKRTILPILISLGG